VTALDWVTGTMTAAATATSAAASDNRVRGERMESLREGEREPRT
jgi:hypothetical protein